MQLGVADEGLFWADKLNCRYRGYDTQPGWPEARVTHSINTEYVHECHALLYFF